MNCEEFTRSLDEHGIAIVDADAGDEPEFARHASECDDCGAVLLGLTALRADPIPAMSRVHYGVASEVRGRPRRRLALAALLACGGAAVAWAGWQTWIAAPSRAPSSAVGPASSTATGDAAESGIPAGASETPDPAAAMFALVQAEEEREIGNWTQAILDALPDGEYFALLRSAPRYPAEAGALGREGEVVTEFTITEAGDVVDVTVYRSTDSLFDESAIEATLQTKYKPRVVDGQGVAVEGVRSIFRFQLQEDAPPSSQGPGEGGEPNPSNAEERYEAADADSGLAIELFAAELREAQRCLEAVDLRCLELELDRMIATYEQDMSSSQRSRLWHFYGFLHHRRGRYQLAIEAYRKSVVRPGEAAHYFNTWPLKIIASIHYELEQYQEAMNAMTEYLQSANRTAASDYVFIDRLRALGATEPSG